MQLKKPGSIKKALSIATLTLLGSTAVATQAEEPKGKWELDTAFLYYSESDRVSVFEPIFNAKLNLKDDASINMKLVVDALTGSSPNGAIAFNTPQTFTRPSNNGSYTAGANETPLDPNYRDIRVALSAEWIKPLGKTLKGIFGAYGSREIDYTSFGISGTLSKDFNNRNTTLTTGLAISQDSVDPLGGVPLGLSVMPAPGVVKAKTGSTDDKQVVDLLIGLTQVISRKMLMQFNFTYGQDDGYLTDPYKILTILTPGGALDPVPATPYIYEKRPDVRKRKALYWQTVYQVNSKQTLRGSYRYYWDDWGIKSHTVDFRYRFNLGGGKHFIQPHFRYYIQDKADFYYYNLVTGATPTYASADFRLADMSTRTIGVKYGRKLGKRSEFGVRLESMKQSSEDSGAPFPDVDAIILQVNYSIKF
ncbi:MAG: DUF3570 domain-containing protein [Gammaproteobacteria bacterium]|nr:MAG: DUF3570 domain-containing protein [Gammaproteobacteria bacterium]